jgi:nucleotide-binding universal stress UspA family protein
MKDVVVGVDQSETARRAAQAAAELASAYGTNLHLVTCMHKQRSIDVGVGSDQFHSDWVSEGEQFLKDLVRSLGCDAATFAVRLGDPAATLCEEAERLDARTIVVGNRRVQGMSRVLGSVAQDVLRKAPCDVLIANTTATS